MRGRLQEVTKNARGILCADCLKPGCDTVNISGTAIRHFSDGYGALTMHVKDALLCCRTIPGSKTIHIRKLDAINSVDNVKGRKIVIMQSSCQKQLSDQEREY